MSCLYDCGTVGHVCNIVYPVFDCDTVCPVCLTVVQYDLCV